MVINSIPEIGRVLRNATMFNFKNPPEAIMTADSLLGQVQQLFDLLDQRKTDYVLVGGIALLTYVEGRNTQDIDLLWHYRLWPEFQKSKSQTKTCILLADFLVNFKLMFG
jgi:hypothetical protein